MCRHLAYLGPEVTVASVLLDPPHGLLAQSYAARELLMGTVAADGFGAAWYRDEAGAEPACFRSLTPIWGDRSFASVARHVRAHAILSNVRNATEVGTNDLANVHPFDHGRWTFTHNGYLDDFRGSFMRRLRAGLSDAHYAALRGATDSETLFHLVLSRIDAGEKPVDALAAVSLEAIALAKQVGKTAQLSLLLSDGARVYGVRASDSDRSNSLYAAASPAAFPGASVVASEPLDEDPAWGAVPHGSVFALRAGEPPDVRPLR